MIDSESATVFFSYSRADQTRALPIIRLIETAGFAVWWDGLIEGGDRFSRTTEKALKQARAVVVLWSKTSVNSHWVHDEATRGRDKHILVPLSLDGTAPPLGFGQFQAIDLSRAKIAAKDTEIQRMIQAIAALHGDTSTPVVPRSVPAAPRLTRRAAIAAGSTAVVVASGVAAWQFGWLAGGGGAGTNRIAILPFANNSYDPKKAYLAEGLATEIRSTLSQNAALQVVGQASSEAFERDRRDIVGFAKRLQAALLIDGAVQVENETIQVTIELIDGKTGVNRPSRTFEKPMDNILAVQREIASAIAAELIRELGSAGAAKATIGGTKNVIAYDHYLRGKDLYAHAKDEAEEREGVAQFEAAIATDPKFAAAHSGRARALASVAGTYGSAAEIKLYNEAAIASARRAVELAPRLADAHSALAVILFQGNLDVKAARAPYDLSCKLGEGEAPVLARFALFCASTGRDSEALTAVRRAILLDPLNALIHRIVGTVHFAARRYPEAITAVRETIKLNPNLADTHSRIGMSLLAQGKNPEALRAFGLDSHKWSKLAGVAIAQRRLGNSAAAHAAMRDLTTDTDTVSLYQQGQVLAQWGDLEAAVKTLKGAYEQRDAGLNAARYDPMLDPLRKHPGFIQLLSVMGFE
ncbi:MAG: TIR domain-containing protein [Sphingorhabdus sp.]